MTSSIPDEKVSVIGKSTNVNPVTAVRPGGSGLDLEKASDIDPEEPRVEIDIDGSDGTDVAEV